MIGLAKRIDGIFSAQDKFAGIVVTIGSNGLEELAYFLHLTVKSSKPVVLTGAQRQHHKLSADGDRNLLDAVRVAALPSRPFWAGYVVGNLDNDPDTDTISAGTCETF